MTEYFIGYTNDRDTRYKGSSGGVGSAVIKYLLSKDDYGTAITFFFNEGKCQYEPRLIHDIADYNNCGSIYQEIDVYEYLKVHLHEIHGGAIITCLPCQVKPIKYLLERHDIKYFIISLCCSGQTTLEGVNCYYKMLCIKKDEVKSIRYRGNGWPSGIQIKLRNGTVIYRENYTYPWTLITQSLLYKPKKCLRCPMKTTSESDILLADPWLKDYEEKDTIGNSIVIVNSTLAKSVIEEMSNDNYLTLSRINEEVFVESQKGSIFSKKELSKQKNFFRFVGWLSDNRIYKRIITATPFLLKIHTYIVSKIQYRILL